MPRGIVLCNIVSALKIMSKLGEDRLLKKFGEQCEGIDLLYHLRVVPVTTYLRTIMTTCG